MDRSRKFLARTGRLDDIRDSEEPMERLEPLPPPRGLFRHPQWSERERAFLLRHPGCAACGIQGAVQAHHIVPVHYLHALGRPELELDDRNLVTLCHSGGGIACDDHHLYVGHLGDSQSFNLNVLADAAGRFRDARKSRLWLSVERIHSLLEMLAAYPHLGTITEAQLASLGRKVDDLFPRVPERDRQGSLGSSASAMSTTTMVPYSLW